MIYTGSTLLHLPANCASVTDWFEIDIPINITNIRVAQSISHGMTHSCGISLCESVGFMQCYCYGMGYPVAPWIWTFSGLFWVRQLLGGSIFGIQYICIGDYSCVLMHGACMASNNKCFPRLNKCRSSVAGGKMWRPDVRDTSQIAGRMRWIKSKRICLSVRYDHILTAQSKGVLSQVIW